REEKTVDGLPALFRGRDQPSEGGRGLSRLRRSRARRPPVPDGDVASRGRGGKAAQRQARRGLRIHSGRIRSGPAGDSERNSAEAGGEAAWRAASQQATREAVVSQTDQGGNEDRERRVQRASPLGRRKGGAYGVARFQRRYCLRSPLRTASSMLRTHSCRASISTSVMLGVAHLAASDSTSSRTRRKSSNRSLVSRGTPIDRPEMTVRARAAVSRCRASRTGIALTPNASASAWIVTSWPGAISPLRINSQSCRKT